VKVITCLFAALVLCATCSFAEPQGAQPSTKKKATRVITDEDLQSTSSSSHQQPPAAEPDTASEKSSSSSAATSSAPASAKTNTAKSDNPQLAALQSRLDELDTDEANLAKGNASLREDLAKEQDAGRREVLQNMLNNRVRSLDRARSERSDINRKIETLKKK
jgi:hypothetical protein